MTAPSTAFCLHPNCEVLMPPGRCCCGRHWFALTEDLRRRYAKTSGAIEARGVVRVEIREYLESRLIGQHEIARCLSGDCAADVVFLRTRRGKSIPVDAATVQADDDRFDRDRHTPHFATCKQVDSFRDKEAS